MTDVNYRYTLTRNVEQGMSFDDTGRPHLAGRLCWVMLNPSTADELVDDPTIRRVIRFTKDHGFADLTVVNLFAARTTRPIHLTEMSDPIGPDNETAIEQAFTESDAVVVAWGAWYRANRHRFYPRPARIRILDQDVVAIAMRLDLPIYTLGLTSDKSPCHPLYIPASQKLVPL